MAVIGLNYGACDRLKALIAIPDIQARYAMAIKKKYPCMRSLLNEYMDPNKTVRTVLLIQKSTMLDSNFVVLLTCPCYRFWRRNFCLATWSGKIASVKNARGWGTNALEGCTECSWHKMETWIQMIPKLAVELSAYSSGRFVCMSPFGHA